MPIESDDELRSILELDTIAVVGCSTTPGKAAHDIPQFMHERGYDVLPVNPYADEVLGRAAYDSLSDVEESVDIVDVFRPSDEVAGVVDEALDREDIAAVWTQQGIRDPEAGARVEDAGKEYVEDRCLKVEYQRLM
ncbi:CoA-binding protein [Halobacteriales archaeon SW_5_68_122]|nr:MAG: CoA-binding protein [Halobacteriales archaeon SW_5_68_122]